MGNNNKMNAGSRKPTPADVESMKVSIAALQEENDSLARQVGELAHDLAAAKSHELSPGKGTPIILRRDANIGDKAYKAGDEIAQIVLAPGCSVNYVVSAISNDLATDKVPEKP